MIIYQHHRFLFSFCLALFFVAATASASDKESKRKKKDDKQTGAVNTAYDPKIEQLLLDAEKAKITEDWDAAITGYKDILKADPANGNAYFQLAQIYNNQMKWTEAENAALAAVKADGTNKWFLEQLANIYMNQGKGKEALEAYKTLTQKFPNNPDYYLNLGYLYSRVAQYDNAIKIYDQFEKNFGIDEQVIEEKKNLYLRLNKFNEAVNEVKKLQDAFPGEVEYLLQEAELYRANKMKDKAIAIYKKILESEPDNPQAQLGLTSLTITSPSGEQSIENLRGIFQNDKVGIDTKISILLLTYIQNNSKDPAKRKEALELAEILTDVHPTEAKAHAMKGDLLYMDEQDDKALAAYQKALELNKDVVQVWQNVILIYNSKRDWSNSLKTSAEAIELFPNQPLLYLLKGGAEYQLKQYEKALKTFAKGEKMSADNAKLRAQFLSNLGDVYHSLNQHTESDSAYEKSLKLDGDNAYVLNNYSYYLSLRKHNLERAKQMSGYSNQLEPNNSSFLDTYAWILFQLKDYKGAKEWQEKALKASEDQSSTLLEHYGDILYMMGNKSDAVANWKKAKELGSDSDTLDRKIAEQKFVE